MTKKQTKKDRGQVLATVVEATGRKKEDVANKAGFSRSSYYKHIGNPNLKFHILIAYGRAIGHDFTEEFPEMPKYTIEEPDEFYGEPESLTEAISMLERGKKKYVELSEKYREQLEKYNQLLERYNSMVEKLYGKR